MIDYDSAKKLVSYFTNVCDTTAFVKVNYDIKPDIGENEMPEAPEVSSITIDYGTNGILVNVFATLEIDAHFEDGVDDDDVACGKRIGFNLSTCAELNSDYEFEKERANLVKKIAESIAQTMEWEWLYD